MPIPEHLDFPGRTKPLRVQEVADHLGICSKQVANLILDGTLVALDLSGAGSAHASYRIPVECYRDFVRRAMEPR